MASKPEDRTLDCWAKAAWPAARTVLAKQSAGWSRFKRSWARRRTAIRLRLGACNPSERSWFAPATVSAIFAASGSITGQLTAEREPELSSGLRGPVHGAAFDHRPPKRRKVSLEDPLPQKSLFRCVDFVKQSDGETLLRPSSLKPSTPARKRPTFPPGS